MRLNVLVVDDEPLAREGLTVWLRAEPDVSTIFEAADGSSAVSVISEHCPDLVFLDVQMPELDGFGVVRAAGDSMPPVVFVTAYDQHAIDAFEINAIDYLLKPVTLERFVRALARARTRLSLPAADSLPTRLGAMLDAVQKRASLARLAVQSQGRTDFVDAEDIRWIAAAENYAEIHAVGGTHLLHVTMNALEAALDGALFIRVHRSAIVNTKFVKRLRHLPHGEFELQLSDGTLIKSGRTYGPKLRELLNSGVL